MILIDPQVGFCSPEGSLGSLYGTSELSEIKRVIPNIKKALHESRRRHLIVSEYSTGQFTDGDTQHPLANLCVPQIHNDCALIDELASIQYHSSVTKYEQSALSSDEFSTVIENDLKDGVRRFVLAGFLLEHCVQATALDLLEKLSRKDTEVIICSDLVASRSKKYMNGIVTSVVTNLRNKGITIEPWNKIQP